jgi:acyl-CoA dehydrogenase
MDFQIPKKTLELRARIREFVQERLIPLEPYLLGKRFDELRKELELARGELKEKGLWSPTLPKEWGGMGLELMDLAHVSEELGRSPLGHFAFNSQAPDAGNMEILIDHGSSEQQERWLRPLTEGKIRSCFAMTEPEYAGSNPTRLGTTAEKDGDDYVINGHKWFTSSADGADFAIVMAVTNPESALPHARASQIIVPMDSSGLERVRNISVMGEAGEGYFSHSELRFTGVRVPQNHLLGAEAEGFKIAQERLGPGRIHHCMRWMGICDRAFELMCRRAVSRELRPGEPLAAKQAVQQWIAESRAEIDAARLLVLRTAWTMQKDGAYKSRKDVSLIKFFAAGVLQRVLDRAIQTHGALGMTDDIPLAFWYSHERAARIYDGADEVHRSVVAREVLKEYGYKRRQERAGPGNE